MMKIILLIFFISFDCFAHGDGHDHDTNMPALGGMISGLKRDAQKLAALKNMRTHFPAINEAYLSDVKPIFKKACFDCHSNQTVFPWYYKIPGVGWWMDGHIKDAKKHMDFSNDYPFISHESPLKDLEELAEVIDENEMPPGYYKLMHSEARLSEEEKKTVLKWIEFARQKLLSDGQQEQHDNL